MRRIESDLIGRTSVIWAEINPRSPSPTDGETVSFVAMADVSESGVIDNVELRKTSTGYTLFAVGDVLVAKITPCFENGKGAHVRGLPTRCGLGSTEFHVLRPRSTTSRPLLVPPDSYIAVPIARRGSHVRLGWSTKGADGILQSVRRQNAAAGGAAVDRRNPRHD